ncbi:phage shock protein operon transcriptional activator [Desulfosediminicola ganghwensis]|uniref:phage shock protein operon transcriptional activator n=1 Tax=Desulfosediminicola ganghwensis TaxID=2569540 RepID=UPI0010ABF5C5|nr:phage shock protein operon transcriptional activator [Desulfosediminicola ganghwensis]
MSEYSEKKREEQYLRSVDSAAQAPADALGQSEQFLHFQERVSRVAAVDRPVLLIGERGTGKELASRRLHFLSSRWSGPFVTLNCAALTPTLIESELFGYEKGAFTGAESRRTGRFEAADGGTLFLDEIGLLPVEVQEKILRVVEYGSFERVGSTRPIEVDVRIVGATNADLPALARQGKFKSDLLDRLSFEVLFVPPLRVRDEDIMLLANHFAARMAYELSREEVPEFSLETIEAMESYSWPGNIRELKNVVERAVYSADDEKIEDVVFNPFSSPFTSPVESSPEDVQQTPDYQVEKRREHRREAVSEGAKASLDKPLKEAVRELEIAMIREALDVCRFNQRKAAAKLSLSYDQLRNLIRKYGNAVLEKR